jgi:hypothetical protein
MGISESGKALLVFLIIAITAIPSTIASHAIVISGLTPVDIQKFFDQSKCTESVIFVGSRTNWPNLNPYLVLFDLTYSVEMSHEIHRVSEEKKKVHVLLHGYGSALLKGP